MADPAAQSPLWWLNKLAAELAKRQSKMQLFDAYYRGDHPLPFLTKAHDSKMRDEFRQLLEDSRSNFMRLVVDAVEERLKVSGFRLSAETDAVADKPSWDIWQANGFDAESQSVFAEALVKGVAYLSVWADTDKDGYPDIAVEDPTQTIVGYQPGSNFRQRAAALKMWVDDWTTMRRANVYLPDGIYKFQSKPSDISTRSTSTEASMAFDERPQWVELPDEFVSNPLGVVPIIPLRNRPRILCEGESELADVYRIQNGINGFLFLLALAGYMGAHKQRWAVGLTIMEDERTGKPKEPFDVDVGKLWVSENSEVKFGEFSQTDLAGYISAIEQKVTHIAVTTRMPKHYLLPEGQEPSGDALRAAEAGLVKKVERKQRPFGEGLEEAIRLARRFAGEPDSPVDSEVVWADAQTDSAAVTADATIKIFAAGLIPLEAAQSLLGFSQTEISRFASMRAGDMLMRQLMAPPAPASAPDAPTPAA
jgi:hypothetical protein